MMIFTRSRYCFCLLIQTILLLQTDRPGIHGFSLCSTSTCNQLQHGNKASTWKHPSSSSCLKATIEPQVNDTVETNLPKQGKDGIYQIESKEQHIAFLEANKDKIVVMKIFAPWCRACKGLAPKYQKIANEEKYANLPLVFTELSIQHNKDYVKSLGVLALPSVQFYVGGLLAENFPCGPSKLPILKRKLATVVNENVDPKTLQLKGAGATSTVVERETSDDASVVSVEEEDEQAAEPDATKVSPFRQMVGAAPKRETPDQTLTPQQLENLRKIPFFSNLSEEEFDMVEKKGRVLEFSEGSIIMKEGNMGSTFYVILEGEVEIIQRTVFSDPLTTPSTYLGAVINRLDAGDFFGERALITGEPRAASIRVTEATRCVAWNGVDLPANCILNRRAHERKKLESFADTVPEVDLTPYNEKYGIAISDLDIVSVDKQIQQSNKANQVRGSVLTPEVIPGVDNDEDFVIEEQKKKPEIATEVSFNMENDAVLSLVQRLKLIRLVSKGFDYMMKNNAKWGDPAINRRRSMLVKRLSNTQREEIRDAFKLVDESGDGLINLLELKRVLVSVGQDKSDDQLREMISKASSMGALDEQQEITFQDFMGIMAEAEFYYLFRDIFASLDTRDIGFVRAKDLDRVLSGVRDLISDDRNSIIDVEDTETLIDYEQFTKMLLGTSL